MDSTGGRILAIVIVHAIVMIVQFLALRFTTISKAGNFGLYLILMPLGFQCFGWDLDAWFLAMFASAGVFVILYSLRKPLAIDEEDKEGIDPT